ncbi:MAG: hypothetical protein ACO1QB_05900, partial [Verrucomicrobiales bacterium]
MAKRKFLRFITWFFVAAIALLLLLAISFPYWFPPLLQKGAARFGVAYSKLERLENNRFAAHDVRYTNAAVDLTISRAEGLMPLKWYQTVSNTNSLPESPTNSPLTFLQVNGWRLTIKDQPKKDSSGPSTNTVYSIYKKVEESAAQLRKWLPRAELLNGIVVFKDKEYSVPLALLDEGKLDLDGTWPESAAPFTVKANVTGQAPLQASFAMNTP